MVDTRFVRLNLDSKLLFQKHDELQRGERVEKCSGDAEPIPLFGDGLLRHL